MGLPGASVVKNPPASAAHTGDAGLIPGWEDPLEEEMAAHSSIPAGESRGQRSLATAVHGLQKGGHDSVTK